MSDRRRSAAPLALLWLVSSSLGGCDPAPRAEQTNAGATPAAPPLRPTPEPATADEVGPRPAAWVEARVDEARARMQADPAGALVWATIEAHGGLATWLARSTVSFEFDYKPLAQPERRMHTRNQVDHWSAHARQTELDGGAGAEATLGWDGRRAWITPEADAFPSSARFWSLTPYYFVGMPFVAADPGTRYERLTDASLDGTVYQLVKLTYGEGVGDAPDDYYILYLHPETHHLAALRYVVSFPGFFPEGGHTPEKLMRYTDPTEVDGLRFAQRLDTSSWDLEAGMPGEIVTEIYVSDIALGQKWPAALFAPPEGAVVTEDL
ncbi:MAG: hypothetical protein R3B40_28425 [Polyangiales bacterium]|nr:hypothetical protein [Myxococcales bacterium]MCB9656114.1 hypothetical protein [Sandaracinaceae bacterium]